MNADLAIDAKDVIGEGPTWDGAGARLLWSDNERGIIHAATQSAGCGWKEARTWRLDRPLAAAIPRARGGLVVCGGIDVFFVDESGQVEPFVSLDEDPGRVRFNDAKCDPCGRLWAGTLSTSFAATAGLYRIDPDGTVHQMLAGIRLANGLGWSPDGATLYFVDSLTLAVQAFDFDVARGTLRGSRSFVAMESGTGAPNGLTVDRDGCVWVAATGTGEVRQFSPRGELLTRISITTPGSTSCAFGGAAGDELFITSLGRRMPEVALTLGLTPPMLENNGPQSGGLFVCRPGALGDAAVPFAG